MRTIRKIVYFAWFVCNLAALFLLGKGIIIWASLNTWTALIMWFAGGTVAATAVILFSITTLSLLTCILGDTELEEKIHKEFTFLDPY